MTKKMVPKYSNNISLWDLDELPLSEVIQMFKELESLYGSAALFNYEGDSFFCIKYEKEETDIEYQRRLEREARIAEVEKNPEWIMYQHLKEKFKGV